IVGKLSQEAVLSSVFVKYRNTQFLKLNPIEFVGEFGNHDLVITDFFHGTCMSILSKVPFLSIDSEAVYSTYDSKIKSLLRSLNVPEEQYLNISGVEQEEALSRLSDRVSVL